LPCRKFNRRRTDEARHEQACWTIVDARRIGILLDVAVFHDGDARRQRHRLHLIMRDIDDGAAEILVQPFDLDAHFGAELGVEIGERFVEEINASLAHQSPPDGHALALAAGELARQPVE